MSRDLQTFNDLGEIGILFQYLWIDQTHYIEFNNGITTLQIRMKDNLFIVVKNFSYPEIEEQSYMDMLYPENLIGIIDYLKHQESLGFQNQWEKIKAVVSNSISLSKLK